MVKNWSAHILSQDCVNCDEGEKLWDNWELLHFLMNMDNKYIKTSCYHFLECVGKVLVQLALTKEKLAAAKIIFQFMDSKRLLEKCF